MDFSGMIAWDCSFNTGRDPLTKQTLIKMAIGEGGGAKFPFLHLIILRCYTKNNGRFVK